MTTSLQALGVSSKCQFRSYENSSKIGNGRKSLLNSFVTFGIYCPVRGFSSEISRNCERSEGFWKTVAENRSIERSLWIGRNGCKELEAALSVCEIAIKEHLHSSHGRIPRVRDSRKLFSQDLGKHRGKAWSFLQ